MKDEAKLGITITIAVIFLIGLMLILKNVNIYEKGYRLIVKCDQAAGIIKGDPVTIAGIRVGKMEDIWLDGQIVNMRIWIKNKYKIPKDSHAFIKTASVMGEKYISITPGISSVILMDGQAFPGSALMDVTDIAIQVEPLTKKLEETISQIGSVLDDQTVVNIKQGLDGFSNSATNLKQIINNSRQDVDSFIKNLKNFSEDLDGLSKGNQAYIDSVITRLEKSSRNFATSSARLDNTLKNLEDITNQVRAGKGALGRIIYDTQFSNRLDSLVLNSNDLIKDVKRNPKRYAKFSIF